MSSVYQVSVFGKYFNKLGFSLGHTYTATALRPKSIKITEVAEEPQLGFAVGRGLVGDWFGSGQRSRWDLFATWQKQVLEVLH